MKKIAPSELNLYKYQGSYIHKETPLNIKKRSNSDSFLAISKNETCILHVSDISKQICKQSEYEEQDEDLCFTNGEFLNKYKLFDQTLAITSSKYIYVIDYKSNSVSQKIKTDFPTMVIFQHTDHNGFFVIDEQENVTCYSREYNQKDSLVYLFQTKIGDNCGKFLFSENNAFLTQKNDQIKLWNSSFNDGNYIETTVIDPEIDLKDSEIVKFISIKDHAFFLDQKSQLKCISREEQKIISHSNLVDFDVTSTENGLKMILVSNQAICWIYDILIGNENEKFIYQTGIDLENVIVDKVINILFCKPSNGFLLTLISEIKYDESIEASKKKKQCPVLKKAVSLLFVYEEHCKVLVSNKN